MDDLMWFLFGCAGACFITGIGICLYVMYLNKKGDGQDESK